MCKAFHAQEPKPLLKTVWPLKPQLPSYRLQKYNDISYTWLHKKVIDDLVYNETQSLVIVFKDYLVYDDINEFLKRRYTLAEARLRLPKMSAFYSDYKLQPMIGVTKVTNILF